MDEQFKNTLRCQLLKPSKQIGISISMLYFFHITFLFKIQPSIHPFFGVWQTSSFAHRIQYYYDVAHNIDKGLHKVGAVVLLRNTCSKKLTKKGSKMEPNWIGPYFYHEVLSKGTCTLSQTKKPNKVLAQKSRLKLYHQSGRLKMCVFCAFKFYTAPKTESDKISKSPNFKTDLTSKASEGAKDRHLCSSKALYH